MTRETYPFYRRTSAARQVNCKATDYPVEQIPTTAQENIIGERGGSERFIIRNSAKHWILSAYRNGSDTAGRAAAKSIFAYFYCD